MEIINIKSLISSLLGIGLLSVSVFANAGVLTVNNQSSTDLSFKVEHQCSSEFGNINAKSAKSVSENDLQNACNPHTDVSEHCHVKVYAKPNCSGTHIESIELSTKDGIFLLEGGHSNPNGKDYNFSANQFYLEVQDSSK